MKNGAVKIHQNVTMSRISAPGRLSGMGNIRLVSRRRAKITRDDRPNGVLVREVAQTQHRRVRKTISVKRGRVAADTDLASATIRRQHS